MNFAMIHCQNKPNFDINFPILPSGFPYHSIQLLLSTQYPQLHTICPSAGVPSFARQTHSTQLVYNPKQMQDKCQVCRVLVAP